jgi:hypothetical protein
MIDKKNILKPKNILQQGPSGLALLFDFSHAQKTSGVCYKLSCSTKVLKEG